jgi:hypothetical protein
LTGERQLLELSGTLIGQQRFSFVILQRPNGKTLSQYFDIISSAQFEWTKNFIHDTNTSLRNKIKEQLQYSNKQLCKHIE